MRKIILATVGLASLQATNSSLIGYGSNFGGSLNAGGNYIANGNFNQPRL